MRQTTNRILYTLVNLASGSIKDDLPARRLLTDLRVDHTKLEDILQSIQEAANHMHGEWEGGHIRFSSPQDQKKHATKSYERLCKLIKEAQKIIDT